MGFPKETETKRANINKKRAGEKEKKKTGLKEYIICIFGPFNIA
jgi:hypothetical protein